MSKDLVTYHGQTTLIDNFVEKYGPCLEQLDRQTKLLLRITLATYVYAKDSSENITAVLRNQLWDLVSTDKVPQVFFDVCLELENLTTNEAEIILDAIQHQLNWGNARLKQ